MAAARRPPRIDAHQHFWSVSRGDYGWMDPADPVLGRDYRPADLAPLLARHRIDATVLVQAAPTAAETDYLLGIADATGWVAGVVGWVGSVTNALGMTYELQIIAATVIGGANLMGGQTMRWARRSEPPSSR